MISHEGVTGVDLGKSRCRVVAHSSDAQLHGSGIGAPGLAAPDGVAAAAAAILAAMPKDVHVARLGVGAAGALAAPAAANQLAQLLAAHFSCPVAVTSDAVTAHAGALGGAPGALLIAGTGAVGFGVNAEGIRVVDGWGPDLGDFGSGAWIGREALRAVLRADTALSGATALTAAVRTVVPADEAIPAWVAHPDGARRCAMLAPVVIEQAVAGDAVATGIMAEAIRLLTATATAAAHDDRSVALHGGLVNSEHFRSSLTDSLTAAGFTVAPTMGDALDGAIAIVMNDSLPHERAVHRATE